MTSPRKYLVVSPTGADVSFHQQWIKHERTFDLMLVNYGPVSDRYRDDSELYYQKNGFKLEIIGAAIDAFRTQVAQYESVWLPDDDLSIETRDINRLFELHTEYELDLAQPAVTGYSFHPPTRPQPDTILRYVNFVEMMCPLFKAEILLEVLWTFSANRSGYGIDWLWSKLLAGKRVAIIDAVTVEHTKPVLPTGPYYTKLRDAGINVDHDFMKVLFQHDIAEQYQEFGRVQAGNFRDEK